jgi:hypothetical protein
MAREARECPQCSNSIRGDSCSSCGWSEHRTTGKPRDPDWWRCSDVERGLRCSKPGTSSHSTLGGGPWYCAQHYFRSPPPATKSEHARQGAKTVKEALYNALPMGERE